MAVRQDLAVLNDALRQALIGLIRNAQVLAATLSRLAIDDIVRNGPADAIILDETSMAGFPTFLEALRAQKRLLLFGDFRQLPPIHLSQTRAAHRWLGRDAFEIVGVRQHIEAEETESRVTLLDTSGLEPACCRELRVGSCSRVNPLHAAVAVTLASQAAADRCTNLALVTPYRMQARLLAVASRGLDEAGTAAVATIHRFQGSERDMVIVDLIDAPMEKGASKLTGNDQDTAPRLLNVALSRPRGKLLVLVHAAFIRHRHPYRSPARRVLQLLAEQGRIVSLDAAILQQAPTSRGMAWRSSWDNGQAQLAWDLQRAYGPVYINFPLPAELPACACGDISPPSARHPG